LDYHGDMQRSALTVEECSDTSDQDDECHSAKVLQESSPSRKDIGLHTMSAGLSRTTELAHLGSNDLVTLGQRVSARSDGGGRDIRGRYRVESPGRGGQGGDRGESRSGKRESDTRGEQRPCDDRVGAS
jgi:hypothetical protein